MARNKYKNPPINELVIGVYFKEPMLALRAEHVGLFWSSVREEYPNSEQNIVIGDVETAGIQAPNEVFPMPRFWFFTEDESHLIQVQRNAFLLNWRKRKQDYPHYENLKMRFDAEYIRFIDFLEKEFSLNPLIERCELTYINVISDEAYFNSFSDVMNVIPSFSSPSIGSSGPKPSDFNLAYVYPIETDLSLRLNIQSRQNRKTGSDTLYFELRSIGALADGTKAEADILLDRAHDKIGDVFNVLTNPEIQHQYWHPIED